MVLAEHVADQLRCYVEKSQRCNSNCGGCSQAVKSDKRLVSLPADILASSNATLAPGDRFELTTRGEILIALSSLVYLAPLLLMLLFAVCSSVLLPGQEGQVALSSVAGLGLGMVAVCFCGERVRLKLQSHLAVAG